MYVHAQCILQSPASDIVLIDCSYINVTKLCAPSLLSSTELKYASRAAPVQTVSRAGGAIHQGQRLGRPAAPTARLIVLPCNFRRRREPGQLPDRRRYHCRPVHPHPPRLDTADTSDHSLVTGSSRAALVRPVEERDRASDSSNNLYQIYSMQ